MSLISLPIEENYVGFEVSTAVVMKGIISQKMILFITTAVENSNPTTDVCLRDLCVYAVLCS
jgi:hypothetical protein